jgi:hypothetical protein
MTLQRLVIDYRAGDLVVRCLYRSADGPGSSTKARVREVTALVRTGLHDALRSLEGGSELVGTSGFTTREDVLCTAAEAPAVHKKRRKERNAT